MARPVKASPRVSRGRKDWSLAPTQKLSEILKVLVRCCCRLSLSASLHSADLSASKLMKQNSPSQRLLFGVVVCSGGCSGRCHWELSGRLSGKLCQVVVGSGCKV